MPNFGHLKNYCEASSIAGVHYLISSHNWLHRLFWLTTVTVSLLYSLYMVRTNWIIWDMRPTKNLLDRIPVTDLRFPAVTVCPEGATPWIAYRNILDRIKIDEEVTSLLPETLKTFVMEALGKPYNLATGEPEKTFLDQAMLTLEPNLGSLDLFVLKPPTEYEEWVLKVDRLYFESCHGDKHFCDFHDKIIQQLKEIQEMEEYKRWKHDARTGRFVFVKEFAYYSLLFEPTSFEFFKLAIEVYFKELAYPLPKGEAHMDAFFELLEKRNFTGKIQHWGNTASTFKPGLGKECDESEFVFSDDRTEDAYQMVFNATSGMLRTAKNIYQKMFSEKYCTTPRIWIFFDLFQLFSLQKAAFSPVTLVELYKNITDKFGSVDNFTTFMVELRDELKNQTSNCSTEVFNEYHTELAISRALENLRYLTYQDGILYENKSCVSPAELNTKCHVELGGSENCSCICKKNLKLLIFKLYHLFLKVPTDIRHLGDSLAWLIKSKLMYLSTQLGKSDYAMALDPKEIWGLALFKAELSPYQEGWKHFKKWKTVSKEIKMFNKILMKELFGSNLDVGLHEFVQDMVLPNSFLMHVAHFPRMISWPLKARAEVQKLFNWEEQELSTQIKMAAPDFANISGVRLSDICRDENGSMPNYCRLYADNLKLPALFNIMVEARHPKQMNGAAGSFALGRFSNQTPGNVSHMGFIPLCIYGHDTKIYHNTPDINMVQMRRDGSEEAYVENLKLERPYAYRLPRCDMFSQRPTDLGICHTFNALKLSRILRNTEWLQEYIKVNGDHGEHFPRIANGIGPNTGFVFAVDTLHHPSISKDQSTLKWEPDSNKFWIKIHNHGELPRITNKDPATWIPVELPNNGQISNMELSIDAEVIGSTDEFRKLPLRSRNCLYSDESKLQLFKHYTEGNCLTECMWQKALEVCGCKPWYIPSNSDESVCFVVGNICFESVMDKLNADNNTNVITDCNCFPSCESIDYKADLKPENKQEQVISFCQTDEYGCWLYGWRELFTTAEPWPETSIPSGTRWYNLADYILDRDDFVYKPEPLLKNYKRLNLRYGSEQFARRQENFVIISMYFSRQIKAIPIIIRDSIMTLDDKIAWIGGTIGVFNGFCLISGVEIVYWSCMIVFGYNKKAKVNQGSVTNSTDVEDSDLDAVRIESISKYHDREEVRPSSAAVASGKMFDVIFREDNESKSFK